MERVTSIDELHALASRLRADSDSAQPTIVIPAGTCGQASGANDLIRVAKRELLRLGLADVVALRITGCHGYCEMEPSVLVEPERIFYPRLTMEGMARLVEGMLRGELVADLLWQDPATGERIAHQDEIPFFAAQRRTLLARNEKVDPIRIFNYLAAGGYRALVGALENGGGRGVLEVVKASGLRGRGGAGFPTGRKWELLAAEPGDRGKVLVCNADEGDPGAYMDRAVLEGNPHTVIEGMLLGALATGASEGIIYVRAEYPLAIKHLVIALRQARGLGLLGTDILGTGIDFDIRLARGAGAFVCGEETALIASIEGRSGDPRQRPPFPVERGVEGRPTAINNVETWANVPLIVAEGAAAFAAVGTPGNAGTKIFSLVGKVQSTGLVEVAMGTSIRHIVYGVGGGASDGRPVKGVQTGGPSGGCLPASLFDLPIDYDSLRAAGSIMGSGGMIVLDEHTCVVDLAHYYMEFLAEESCGKCFTCRKGTQRMAELLEDVTHGRATLTTLDLLEELALTVRDTTMCGLGQSAPNPVLSTLRYFHEEYVEHVVHKRCRAGVCTHLTGPACQGACPVGTQAWNYIAHIERGEYEEAYRAIRRRNPFPSVCARLCHHPCESRCRLGQSGERPVAIRALKRFITDTVDPGAFHAERPRLATDAPRVAVVGAGPAGLTAAWELVQLGYHATVFEAGDRAGGMLVAGVPPYRLPRTVLEREITALLADGVALKCGVALGRDLAIDDLFAEGFAAVFLAVGAHRSRRLGIAGEDAAGVIPSMPFLEAVNLHGENAAHGRVGVIGGGNSAVDAARVARRQPGVDSVTIYYRRSREEMPAFPEEVAAALDEGIRLETLVTPAAIHAPGGRLEAVELIRNRLGAHDASGRRLPEPIPGSETTVKLDTLVVAIGEQLQPFLPMEEEAAALVERGRVRADRDTLLTPRPGVFAGGDAVTGPNTVIDAIAAGQRAARSIHRFLLGEELMQPASVHLPVVYIAPSDEAGTGLGATAPIRPAAERTSSFAEVEMCFTAEQARAEARRCLRCDIEFTEALGAPRAEGVHT